MQAWPPTCRHETRATCWSSSQAFSRLDGRAIGDCTLKFSGIKQTCPDPEAFKQDLTRYFTEIQREQEWVETNGADAMSAVLELVRRHKVRSAETDPARQNGAEGDPV